MKTEKTMKAKKITLLSAVVAIVAVAITLTAVLLPKYKVTKASTGNEKNTAEIERTISQIESLEAEYQKSFDENAALWEKYFAEFQKLDEIPENFDERAFIKELKTLTDDEKTALLKNVDALDALDAKLDMIKTRTFFTTIAMTAPAAFPETDAASTTCFLSNAMKIVSLKTAENKKLNPPKHILQKAPRIATPIAREREYGVQYLRCRRRKKHKGTFEKLPSKRRVRSERV